MPKHGQDCQSRSSRRQSTKSKLRKRCQGKTQGTIARARRVRYAGPRPNSPSFSRPEFGTTLHELVEEFSTELQTAPPEPLTEAQVLEIQCHATTKAGKRCRNSSLDFSAYCRVHQDNEKTEIVNV